MRKPVSTFFLVLAFVTIVAGAGFAATAQTRLTIAQAAMVSKDHTTLARAWKAAGLVSMLEGAGPFTVFAPTNAAFDSLPAGAMDSLMEPRNQAALRKLLKYQIVRGRITTGVLKKRIENGDDKTTLKTLEGGTLTVTERGGRYILVDQKGGQALITDPDQERSNGVVQGINAVLMPQ